jgi:glycosyltransferase involved in cell wall biosynthesis
MGTMMRSIRTAREVLRVSGPQALWFRGRKLAVATVLRRDQLQLPVAIADVLAVDWSHQRQQALPRPDPQTGPLTINWVLPPIVPGSGGQTTIFRFVRYLESKGHTCRIYLYDPDPRTSFREQSDVLRGRYKPMLAEVLPFTPRMEPCDALVATMWQTAYAIFNSPVAAARFYFVQDFEPYFYPAGTESVLAANTYRFGFHGITAGRWLSTKLAREYGMACDHFDLGADGSQYVNQGRGSRLAVVFYARPGTPWRGFVLGVMALALFHNRHPEYQIHMIGQDLGGFRVPFPFVSHGVLGQDQLNTLYNGCSAGLVISLTNMSLMPLELLAAGCIPVVNDAVSNRAVSNNRYIQYADPSPHALAARLCAVVEREDLGNYAEEASKSVRRFSWDGAGAQVESILLRQLRPETT